MTEIEFENVEESYRSLDHCYVTGTVRSSVLQSFLLSEYGREGFVATLPESVADLKQNRWEQPGTLGESVGRQLEAVFS